MQQNSYGQLVRSSKLLGLYRAADPTFQKKTSGLLVRSCILRRLLGPDYAISNGWHGIEFTIDGLELLFLRVNVSARMVPPISKYKIDYRIQIMFKLVIWIDLNAQSVCTYQLWIFLILWCSTFWEDSIDYKFVIFGHLNQKIWFKQANRRVWFNLKMNSNWILNPWIISALMDSRCSKDSIDILFAIFGPRDQKIWILQDWI
jgi:hypothetical protein